MKKLFKIATTLFMAAFFAVITISCELGAGITINPGAGIQEENTVYPAIQYLTVRYQAGVSDTVLTTESTYTANIPAGATFEEIEAKAKALCSAVAEGFEARAINFVSGNTYEINFYRKEVTLTFKVSSAANADVYTTLKGIYGASYSVPGISGLNIPEGKKFNYWYCSSPSHYLYLGASITFPATDRTYYASTSNITYLTVNYKTEIGTAPDPLRIEYGKTLTAADLPTLENVVDDRPFLGWYIGSNKINAGYTVSSSITLTAKWGNFYTITYIDPFNYADVPATQRVASGTTLAGLLDPITDSAYGFTSTHWVYENGNKAYESHTVTSNIKLYAQWKARYTLNYISKYGDTPASKVVEDGYLLTTSDFPVLTNTTTGFTNRGWYTNKDFTSSISAGNRVYANYTFYAKWLDVYAVKYKTTYGVAPKTVYFEHGSAIGTSALPVITDPETGFVSIGWKDVNGNTISSSYLVKENIELTAIWKPRYTISYNTHDSDFTSVVVPGKIVENGYVIKYSDLPAVETSDKDSKRYVSVWYYDDGTTQQRIEEGTNFAVTSDITLLCKWYRLYDISYETAYGIAPNAFILPQGDYLSSSNLVPVTEASTGFSSLYWYVKGDESKTQVTTSTVISADTVLVAAWKERYTVSYSTDYGLAPASLIVESGTALTKAQLAAVQLDSNPPYFVGWYNSGNKIKAGYIVTGNLVLTANWSMTVVPIYYSSEYGVVPSESYIIPGSILTDEELPVLTENYRFFVGWYDEDGYLAVPGEYVCNSSCTFTAKWSRTGIRQTIPAYTSKTVDVPFHYFNSYVATLLNDNCSITSVSNFAYSDTISTGYQYKVLNFDKNNYQGTYNGNFTVSNSTAEDQYIVIYADYSNQNSDVIEITSTVLSTNKSDLFEAQTNFSNHYKVQYEMSVAENSRLYIQWYDSYNKLTSLGSVNWADQYIYIYDADTGVRLTSKDDGNITSLQLSGSTKNLLFIVGGRTNTCTSYFRPYILN